MRITPARHSRLIELRSWRGERVTRHPDARAQCDPEAPMPERQFVDREGRRWEVWEVCPDVVERRLASDPQRAPQGQERRRAERRAHLRIPDRLRAGWLAFETTGQRRRLAPVPERWRFLTDAELEALLTQTRLVPRLDLPPDGTRSSPQ